MNLHTPHHENEQEHHGQELVNEPIGPEQSRVKRAIGAAGLATSAALLANGIRVAFWVMPNIETQSEGFPLADAVQTGTGWAGLMSCGLLALYSHEMFTENGPSQQSMPQEPLQLESDASAQRPLLP